jgi:hypothetical protein
MEESARKAKEAKRTPAARKCHVSGVGFAIVAASMRLPTPETRQFFPAVTRRSRRPAEMMQLPPAAHSFSMYARSDRRSTRHRGPLPHFSCASYFNHLYVKGGMGRDGWSDRQTFPQHWNNRFFQ